MTVAAHHAQAVFRFAPSPNGALHLGHAMSALVGFDMARAWQGRFLVRIEDIDTVRCRREWGDAALADLAWLGISWEDPVMRQSEHFEAYRQAAARLRSLGVIYPCFATRADIAAAAVPGAVDPDGAPLYPGLWRDAGPDRVAAALRRGAAAAWRLDMGRALDIAATKTAAGLTFTAFDEAFGECVVRAQPERWGDVVLVRKDTPTSYHLAVVVDDARQGVTHVTRGLDLLAATDLHRLLQVLLGLPEPRYHHHRLITDMGGRKLAKSTGSRSLAAMREGGATPALIRNQLGLAAQPAI